MLFNFQKLAINKSKTKKKKKEKGDRQEIKPFLTFFLENWCSNSFSFDDESKDGQEKAKCHSSFTF